MGFDFWMKKRTGLFAQSILIPLLTFSQYLWNIQIVHYKRWWQRWDLTQRCCYTHSCSSFSGFSGVEEGWEPGQTNPYERVHHWLQRGVGGPVWGKFAQTDSISIWKHQSHLAPLQGQRSRASFFPFPSLLSLYFLPISFPSFSVPLLELQITN